MNVPFETDRVPLLVESNDPNATIIVNNGTPVKHTFTGSQLLEEGPNCITVWVTAEDGIASDSYQIFVTRAPRAPKLLTLGVNGEILLDMDGIATEFDPETNEYRVNVPFYHEIADIYATSSEPSDTIVGTGIKPLNIGENEMYVTITNVGGITSQYLLLIRRYSADSTNADAATAWIEEIDQFKTDFKPLKTNGYEYTISNKYDEVHVHFEAEINAPKDGLPAAKVDIYGDKNLHSGLNNVVVVITAPDGITTKVYVINITKKPMEYEVSNKQYPDFTVTPSEDEESVYNVNIGNKKSVDVDFTKFINNLDPDNSELEIVVVSDVKSNPSEVIVSVSDGEEVNIIRLVVQSTRNPKSVDMLSLWPLYLLLAIIIIVLILILISVNKDKFGKVAKKANNKNEKNDEQEAEKQKK